MLEGDPHLDALRDNCRAFLSAECQPPKVLDHALGDGGVDKALWARVTDLGWPLLVVPEDQGDMGLGVAALAIVYEELGRALAPLPFLPTMLAAEAIALGAPEPNRAQWLARIAAGACCAVADWATAPQLSVVENADGASLDGAISNLIDAADAELLVLAATDAAGRAVRVVVDTRAEELALERLALWDRTRSLSTILFDKLPLPAGRIFVPTPAAEQKLQSHAAIGLAADSVGGSDAVLGMTIDYMKVRQQFGRPIGSFQALKHRIADLRTRLEGDRALLHAAVSGLEQDDAQGHADASAAKAMACGNYVHLGREAIQLHGGVGYTVEYPCHLYAKRALMNDLAFGDHGFHLHRMMQLAWGWE